MNTEQPGVIISITAAAAISKNQCVMMNGYPSEAGGFALLGIAAADTDVGEECPVAVSGVVLAISGTALTQGLYVQCGDDGRVLECTLFDELAAGYAVGHVLDAASAAGELVRIKLS